MRSVLLTLLCCFGVLVSGCSKSHTSDSQKSDSAIMQGTWSGQQVGVYTQVSPSLIIQSNYLEFHGADSREWYKATFTLRPDTNPKRLDAVVTDCPLPKYVGQTAHAIYKIEDGKLMLDASEPGDPTVMATFGEHYFVFTKK